LKPYNPALPDVYIAREDSMTRQEIAALFDRWQTAINQHDVAALAREHAVDCVLHSPMAGTVNGRAAIAKVYDAWFTAFPDFQLTSDVLLIDGDRAVQTATVAGTDKGGFMGLLPTGKPLRFPVVLSYTLQDGRISKFRTIYDFTGLLVQVGVLKAKFHAAPVPSAPVSLPPSRGDHAMSRDEMVGFFTRRKDAHNRHDAVALARQHADTCVVESPMAGIHSGRAAIQEVFNTWFTAFPDVRITDDDVLVDGDRVAQSANTVGTDTGGFMGLPPTGKKFQLPIVFLCTLKDQAIVHERRIYDFTGMLVQIGVLKARPA
jgi:steroid delta-isomerase-like uncharacterized protein